MRMSHVAKFQNVQIRSILGRFLEHSRIYYFHNDGNPEYLIGSADIMDRNLNRRIETLVYITDEVHKRELALILDQSFNNEFRHWKMDETDRWIHTHLSAESKPLSDFQSFFINYQLERDAK